MLARSRVSLFARADASSSLEWLTNFRVVNATRRLPTKFTARSEEISALGGFARQQPRLTETHRASFSSEQQQQQQQVVRHMGGKTRKAITGI